MLKKCKKYIKIISIKNKKKDPKFCEDETSRFIFYKLKSEFALFLRKLI